MRLASLSCNLCDPDELICHRSAEPTLPRSDLPIELQLKDDETIINPHYMQQLLKYGLRMGSDPNDPWTDERVAAEAEVSFFLGNSCWASLTIVHSSGSSGN